MITLADAKSAAGLENKTDPPLVYSRMEMFDQFRSNSPTKSIA
jgi:hypothetical protein